MAEIWLYAMHHGKEYGRMYIATVSNDEDGRNSVDVYIKNGCGRQRLMLSALPFAIMEYRFITSNTGRSDNPYSREFE